MAQSISDVGSPSPSGDNSMYVCAHPGACHPPCPHSEGASYKDKLGFCPLNWWSPPCQVESNMHNERLTGGAMIGPSGTSREMRDNGCIFSMVRYRETNYTRQ